jgi:hypothetical protein
LKPAAPGPSALARIRERLAQDLADQKRADELERVLATAPAHLKPFVGGLASLLSIMGTSAETRRAARVVMIRQAYARTAREFDRLAVTPRRRRKGK